MHRVYKKPLWQRLLCLLMVALVLVSTPLATMGKAKAVVPVAAAGGKLIWEAAIIGTGYYFAHKEDIHSFVQNTWKNLGESMRNKFDDIASKFDNTMGAVLRINKDIMADVESFLSSRYDASSGVLGLYPANYFDTIDRNDYAHPSDYSSVDYPYWLLIAHDTGSTSKAQFLCSTEPFEQYSSGTVVTHGGWLYDRVGDDWSKTRNLYWGGYGPSKIRILASSHDVLDAYGEGSVEFYATGIGSTSVSKPYKGILTDYDTPVIALPKGATNVGDIWAQGGYADVTSPNSTMDEKEIAALPLDVPTTKTGTGTGEGTGEGTGTETGIIGGIKSIVGGILDFLKAVWELLKSLLEGIKSGVLSIPSILSGILDAIASWFDSPTSFRLNLDGMKSIILFDRFPFCIPFDLVRAVKHFASNADFQLRIDMDTKWFSIHYAIDMSPFRIPVVFFRSFLLFAFVVFLLMKTRDVMKW